MPGDYSTMSNYQLKKSKKASGMHLTWIWKEKWYSHQAGRERRPFWADLLTLAKAGRLESEDLIRVCEWN